MVKHTQTIRRQLPTTCLDVFDHFVGLALKELRTNFSFYEPLGFTLYKLNFGNWVDLKLFHDGGRYHIQTSPLICSVNQWTGFYMTAASVMKELMFCEICQTVEI